MANAPYPSVGLRVDLGEIVQANIALAKTKKNFDAVGVAAAGAADQAKIAATAIKNANKAAGESTRVRAVTEKQASASFLRQMREQTAAIKLAAAANQAASRQVIDQLRAEEVAQRSMIKATREAERAARDAAKAANSGGGGRSGGGGLFNAFFGSGGPRAFLSGLGSIRDGLGNMRRLFFDVRTAVGLFLGGLVVKPLIDMADAMTALGARVGFFAQKATDVPYLMEAIYRTAQNSRTPLQAIATLYTRLAPLAERLGRSQQDILNLTGTVAKGIQIGGATREEATASSQQLAQALASNRLGGDELRSLAENAPILLNLIAKQLNMSTGEFIKWAHAGNASSEVVVKALESAKGQIDAMFKAFPLTIGQALAVVSNSFTHLVGEVNKATGVSQKIAQAIAGFSSFLDRQSTIEAVSAAVMGLGKAFQFISGIISTLIQYLPAIAAVLALIAARFALAAIAGSAFGASMKLVAVQAALGGSAMSLLKTGMSGAMSSIGALVNMLGGPWVIAIGAAIAAFMYLYSVINDGHKAADNLQKNFQNTASAVQNAITWANSYGQSSADLTNILVRLGGVQDQVTDSMSDAQKQAVANAEIQRQMAMATLSQTEAELREAKAKVDQTIAWEKFFQTVHNGLAGLKPAAAFLGFLLGGGSGAGMQLGAAFASSGFGDALKTDIAGLQAASNSYSAGINAAMSAREALGMMKGKVTIPDAGSGVVKNGTGTTGKGATDGALNRIAKMREELAGLKAEAKSISSNPLSAFAAQIEAAGKEASAQLENGRNKGLQYQAYLLASATERQKIANQFLRSSAEQTHASEVQAAQEAVTSAAQAKSNDIMARFWASGTRSAEEYAAALEMSRVATADAQVATNNLAIAGAFGAKNLDDISEALIRNKVAYGEQAQAIEDAAKKQADADAKGIYGKVAGDAKVSAPEDRDTYRATQAQILVDDMADVTKGAQDMAAAITGSFGEVGDAIGGVIGILARYASTQASVEKTFVDATKGMNQTDARWVKASKTRDDQLKRNKLESYADLAGASKGFFSEQSRGYKLLEAAEKGFRLYEFAMSAKSIVIKAAETAAKIGLFGAEAQAAAAAGAANMFATLGPGGFAAVAAMVAVLAGVGVALSGGGGKVPNYESSEQRQAKQGTGSVLGMPDQQSQSLLRAVDIVAANSNKDLEYSNAMVDALKAIENSIGAVANVLAQQLSLQSGAFNTSGLGLGTVSGGPGLLTQLLSPLAMILPGLFGKKVTTTLADQGLNFGSQTVGQIAASGLAGNVYQDTLVNTKKKAFGITYSNKTSLNTATSPLDGDLTQQTTLLIASLREGVVASASVLGVTSAQAVLDALVLNIGKISFKDMTGEEIQAQLNAVFGKVADDMATAVLPIVSQFQKVGEGSFETLVRLARDYQVVDVTLDSIGKTFNAVGVSSIAARERLIELSGGLDNFTEQAAFFAENFLTQAERMAPIQRAVTAELARLGLSSVTTRDEFKNIVMGLDTSTAAGAEMYSALMALAPAFAAITDAAQEQFASLKAIRDYSASMLTGSLSPYNPQTILGIQEIQYNDVLNKARLGDQTALGNLPNQAQAYLEQAQEYYGTSAQYAAIFEQVRAALEEIGGNVEEDPAIRAISDQTDFLLDGLLQSTNAIVDAIASMTEAIVTSNTDGLSAVNENIRSSSMIDGLLAGGVAAG